MGLTYRRDINSGRPRVNKPDSKVDREQKEKGQYYYVAKLAAAGAPRKRSGVLGSWRSSSGTRWAE